MNERKANAPELFCVTVDGAKNQEWQGTIRFADGTQARFESLLNLLCLVRNKFEIETPAWEQAETK